MDLEPKFSIVIIFIGSHSPPSGCISQSYTAPPSLRHPCTTLGPPHHRVRARALARAHARRRCAFTPRPRGRFSPSCSLVHCADCPLVIAVPRVHPLGRPSHSSGGHPVCLPGARHFAPTSSIPFFDLVFDFDLLAATLEI